MSLVSESQLHCQILAQALVLVRKERYFGWMDGWVDECTETHFQFRLRGWHVQSLPIYRRKRPLTHTPGPGPPTSLGAALVSSSSYSFLNFPAVFTKPSSPRQALS